MIGYLKYLTKKYFYPYLLQSKFSASTQIVQKQLQLQYSKLKRNNNLPKFGDTGFKVFSQFEEDGKILYLFSILGTTNKLFVDIGSNDGINSNCANLAINHGWHGLFIDADKKAIEIGQHFYKKVPNKWSLKPIFKKEKVTPKNINSIIENVGFSNEIDFLSIDIDSNDYWIWKALTCVHPKVIIIESQLAFGSQDLIVPYQKELSKKPNQNNYYGASTLALVKLGKSKGYRLVGSNQYGNNLFFVKNGLGEEFLPEIDFKTTLQSPYAKLQENHFEAIKHLTFITE